MKSYRSFSLVEIMIVLAIIAVIALIAIPSMLEAKKAGTETNAMASLKSIAAAQTVFREQDKDGDGRTQYGTLDDLAKYNLLDPVLATGKRHGYLFTTEASTTHDDTLWWATAFPAVPGTTGSRAFGINNNGVIYYTTDMSAPLAADPATCAFPTAKALSD